MITIIIYLFLGVFFGVAVSSWAFFEKEGRDNRFILGLVTLFLFLVFLWPLIFLMPFFSEKMADRLESFLCDLIDED